VPVQMKRMTTFVKVGYFKKTKKMNKIQSYFKDSYNELMEKVTWPNWQQLQQSTMIVLVATLVITAIVWVLDLGSSTVLKFIYSLFK
jgi:preprotein translocase subunit SecE